MKKILPLLLVLSACEKIVEVELPGQEQKPVMNTIVNSGDSIRVYVSLSSPVLSSEEPKQVRNATVQMRINGGAWEVLPLGNSRLGTYRYDPITGTYGQDTLWPYIGPVQGPGNTYEFRATVPGFETAAGTTISPILVLPQDRRWLGNPSDGQLEFKLEDPGNEINYYRIRVLDAYSAPIQFTSPDPLLLLQETSGLGDASEGQAFTAYLTDETFNGQSKIVRIDLLDETPGTRWLEITHLDRNNYLYQLSYYSYEQNLGNPFAEPVPVHTNVVNGLGLVAGQTTATIAMP